MLDTRSVTLSARPSDFVVTLYRTHQTQTFLERSSPTRHFWARARFELWSGSEVAVGTLSTMPHRSFDAVARGDHQVKNQHDLQSATD